MHTSTFNLHRLLVLHLHLKFQQYTVIAIIVVQKELLAIKWSIISERHLWTNLWCGTSLNFLQKKTHTSQELKSGFAAVRRIGPLFYYGKMRQLELVQSSPASLQRACHTVAHVVVVWTHDRGQLQLKVGLVLVLVEGPDYEQAVSTVHNLPFALVPGMERREVLFKSSTKATIERFTNRNWNGIYSHVDKTDVLKWR